MPDPQKHRTNFMIVRQLWLILFCRLRLVLTSYTRAFFASTTDCFAEQALRDFEPSNLNRPALKELESKLEFIDSNLKGLANPSMVTGVGVAGYRSMPSPNFKKPVMIKIDLAE